MDGGRDPGVFLSPPAQEARRVACSLWRVQACELEFDGGPGAEARDALAWLFDRFPQLGTPYEAEAELCIARHYSRLSSNVYYERWRELVLRLRLLPKDAP